MRPPEKRRTERERSRHTLLATLGLLDCLRRRRKHCSSELGAVRHCWRAAPPARAGTGAADVAQRETCDGRDDGICE